ncbi:MAG: hypothetical protein LBL43_01085 [Treponema sp.]|nr:hypothetical protein [Treponema sp.]
MKTVKFQIIFIAFMTANINLYADTFYLPNYTPNSLGFFSSELQNVLSINHRRNYFYASMFCNMYGTTKHGQEYGGGIRGLTRLAGSGGTIIPVWDYLSLAANFTYISDDADIANTDNFFTSGGLIGSYNSFGLGLFAGYYRDDFTEYTREYDSVWDYWEKIPHERSYSHIKFAIAPVLGLSNYIFFIDKISGSFDLDTAFDIKNILTKIAFSAIQIGASRLGINLYYKQEEYNVIADQQLFGISFETQYIKFDGGYRRFINIADAGAREIGIYDDGLYGRITGKIPLGKKREHWLVLSAAVERSINWIPTFGIGYSIFGNYVQALVEGGYNDGFGFNGFMHYDTERMMQSFQ